MENAVVAEIYGKHDGHLHFSSQTRMRFFINAKSSASSNARTIAPSVIATHKLNRAIVTFSSTTNCADALPSESGHVLLVLNVKCESNIFRFHPEHRDIEETLAFE